MNSAGTNGYSGVRKGAPGAGRRARNLKSDATVRPSINRISATASVISSVNVPLAASAIDTRPISAIAVHGVSPAFTRVSSAALRPEDRRRDVSGDEVRRRYLIERQHVEKGGVEQEIEHAHHPDAKEEDPRQRSLGLNNLLSDLPRVHRSVVGPDHGRSGCGERAE